MEDIIYEFEPLWNEWKVQEELGEGSFGKVWSISKQDDNGKTHKAAVKMMTIPPSEEALDVARVEGLDREGAKKYYKEVLNETLVEVELMQDMLECPNIVRFEEYQVVELKKSFGWAILIRMEELVTLKDVIINNEMSIYDVAKLGIDISKALEFCMKKGIVHRDIKPENIFYSKDTNTYKLGDFGISHYIDRPTAGKGKAGTLSHMSPEVYNGRTFEQKDDLYALGIILYRLLNNNRIPLLPYYPGEFGVKQRDKALIDRLKGEKIPLPSICLNSYTFEDVGIKIKKEEIPLAIRLGKIAQKAIAASPNERFESAKKLRIAIENELKNK